MKYISFYAYEVENLARKDNATEEDKAFLEYVGDCF